ncbi:LPS assembly lipoprotein LptE [Candidatus Thioglobus sp.]|uniref:LPS assembly lipoprotein LptE n=1 Tax=Candidatus Thioglobus sp. TaxID=2026721 RepID=UPI003D0BC319
MSKINLLVALFLITLLSSCGFHTPIKNSALNAVVVSDKSNVFANELRKRFNPEAAKNLTIHIGTEAKKQQAASYTSNDTISSYTLSLSVPVKVLNAEQKILLSQDLSASMYLNKLGASSSRSQADRLQIQQAYAQLQNKVIKKLIRRLSKLNED